MLYSYTSLKNRREVTKAVADMLSVNERVEAMSYDDSTFEKYYWAVAAYVSPRLEYKAYRKLFPSTPKIWEASTHAAILARTLAKFASKAHR
jgi:hypothetical protein